MHDHSDRKVATTQLDDEALRDLIDAAFDSLVITRKGIVVFANRSFIELSGWPPDQILGRSVLEFVAPESQEHVLQQMQKTPDCRYEATAVLRDGSRLDVEICARECLYKGEPARVTAIRYITDRKHAEQTLRRSEARFRELIERMPDMIAVHRDGTLVFVNPASLKYLGYERMDELVGLPVTTIFHPDDNAAATERVRWVQASSDTGSLTTFRSVRKDGSHGVVEVTSVAVDFDGAPAVLLLGRDVAERKQMEARLLQADLLASMGMLAAGIAHEINNPLAYITINLGIMARKLQALHQAAALLDDESLPATPKPGAITALARELTELLRESREGAERVGHIVRDFRLFARGDSGKRALLDVRNVFESTLKIAHNEIRHRAQLVKEYGQPPLVDADEARLGQLFLNLLVNAIQALPETGDQRKEIRVSLRATDDGWALIEVSDTGAGIPSHLLGRVFEPFFSTKRTGTGIGLSICHSIVDSLGGRIEIQSELGKGTTCRVMLPPAAARAERPACEPPVPAPPPHRTRLLVVDDEEVLVKALVHELSREHEVTSALNGAKAIDLMLTRPFDLVLCDLMMPELSGMDVYERVRKTCPGLEKRLVFMTGGAFTSTSRQFLERVPNRHIEKPFSLDELRALLRDLEASLPALER